MILLLAASAVSFAVQEWVDGGVILAIALVNIFIGVAQEVKTLFLLYLLEGKRERERGKRERERGKRERERGKRERERGKRER